MTGRGVDGPDRATMIDTTVPSVARVYDYFLHGKDNFAVDRKLAEQILQRTPDAALVLRANRAFLGRAVRHLAAEAGIEQFVDIGTGLPTRNNVHQVAQRHAPQARVVYVDNDPAVLAHAHALLAEDGRTTVLRGDLRDPATLLEGVRARVDLDRPVALMLVAILHFIPDADDPHGIVRTLVDALAPGSFLVISHGLDRPDVRRAAQLYDQASAQGHIRTRDQIATFFDGLDLVEPGLVPVDEWRPGDAAPGKDAWFLAGAARVPPP